MATATKKTATKKAPAKKKAVAKKKTPAKARRTATMTETRKALLAMVTGSLELAEIKDTLDAKKAGTYTNAVLAGIHAGDKDTLAAELESFQSDIRTNKGKLAEKLKCVPAKRQPKEGGTVYNVPSAVMTAKSVLLSAYECGVDLGDVNEPRSFNAIRSEIQAIRAIEKRNALAGEDLLRAEIVEGLERIKDRSGNLEGEALETMHSAIMHAVNNIRASAAENSTAQSDASDLAAAA